MATSMKKAILQYIPYLFILISVVLMIIDFLNGESYKYHISNILFIGAMLFVVFERNRKKKE